MPSAAAASGLPSAASGLPSAASAKAKAKAKARGIALVKFRADPWADAEDVTSSDDNL